MLLGHFQEVPFSVGGSTSEIYSCPPAQDDTVMQFNIQQSWGHGSKPYTGSRSVA